MNRTEMLVEVAKELARAEEKFAPFNSAHEGYAIIKEELDELWAEVMKKKDKRSRKKMRREAIQIAAMGMRFVLNVTDKEEP